MFLGSDSIISRGFFPRGHGWEPSVNRTGEDAFGTVAEVHFLGDGYPPRPASAGREN